jgi:hypothetical protein
MAIEMVNGYACNGCSEVAMAKRGIDPQQPTAVELSLKDQDRQAGTVMSEAISALAEDARPRATLDYAKTLDRLI